MKKLLLILLGVPFIGQSQCWETIVGHTESFLIQKSDGSLYAYGWNQYGQLGPQANYVTMPALISEDTKWTSFSTSNSLTLAVKEDGSLWAMGRNNGTFGNGQTSSVNQTSFVEIPNITSVSSISTDGFFSVAIKTDGTLWAWGSDAYEALGLGAGDNTTSIPVQIGSDSDWVSAKACGRYGMALKSDGTLWGWGKNDYYVVSPTGDENGALPVSGIVQIGDMAWSYFDSFEGTTFAIKPDGTLWAWGYTCHGAIGLGPDTLPCYIGTPMQIGTGTNWKKAVTSHQLSAAITNDGTLWTTGFGMTGGLANNTWGNKNVWAQVQADSQWLDVAVGINSSQILNSQGTFFDYGATGNPFYDGYASPLSYTGPACQLGFDQNRIELSLWPNPTSGMINISAQIDAEKYVLVDASGRVVSQGKVSQNQIDLSGIAQGMYFVEVESAGEKLRSKILVK